MTQAIHIGVFIWRCCAPSICLLIFGAVPGWATTVHQPCFGWGTLGFPYTALRVQACLEAGGDPHAQTRWVGTRPVSHLALLTDANYETVWIFLAAGVDPNVQTANGGTLLMIAASGGQLRTVGLLLAAGAKVSVQTKQGWTALMSAAGSGHAGVVSRLLGAGADPTLRTNQGRTALMEAAKEGHKEVLRVLLRQESADSTINLQDHQGHTALMEAIWGSSPDAAFTLLFNGADYTKLKDKEGRTALAQVKDLGQDARWGDEAKAILRFMQRFP